MRHRAQVPTHGFANIGAEQAKPAPGVLEAIATADVVLLAPSNPVVSIGAILAVPGIRGRLRTTAAKVIGVCPVVDGKPLRGMADECLSVIGVRDHRGGGRPPLRRARRHRHPRRLADPHHRHRRDPRRRGAGVPLLMTDPATTAEMVRDAWTWRR